MKWAVGIAIVVVISLSAAIALSMWGMNALNASVNINEPVLFTVEPGQSPRSVAKKLNENRIVSLPGWLTKLWFKLNPEAIHIKAGTYELMPGQSFITLFATMSEGKVRQFSVSLIEGQTLQQWLEVLSNQPYLVNDVKTENFPLFSGVSGMPDNAYPEGVFLADSYFYTSGTHVSEILRRANEDLVAFVQQTWQERDVDLPLRTPYEALILASIIEKETAVAAERPLIAGVFVNRLNRNMRLQTDPTIIYGLGDRFDGDIKYAHLREKTAYNTYVIKGLPPTPIAMPGREAILAALHPQKTEALYFVAKGDGSHVFSSSLEAHNAAVNQYQRNQGPK